MKLALRMTLVLTGIGLFSGGVLALSYEATKARIEANAKRAQEEAARALLPGATTLREHRIDRSTLYYEGLDQSGQLLGYAVITQGPGFQGVIKLAFGVDPQLRECRGVIILEQVETPGLGARISEEGWRAQFKGLLFPLEVVKGKRQKPNQVEAVTGATISSRSVCNIVNAGLDKLREALK